MPRRRRAPRLPYGIACVILDEDLRGPVMLKFLTDWWPYIAGVIGALWVAWTYFDTRAREKAKTADTPKVSASNGSIAAAGDVTISGISAGGNVRIGGGDGDTPPTPQR
jgi:hypothetical protein